MYFKVNRISTAASMAVLVAALTGCSSFAGKQPQSVSSLPAVKLPAGPAPQAKLPTLSAAQSVSMSAADDSLVPPNAKPGQCFTRIWNPPQYETVTSRQLVEQASERIEVIPASYKPASKRILVKEASEKIEIVPATYKTVTERVLVKPATSKLQQVPAVYETVSTRVLDKPAHSVWKKGTGPIQKIDAQSGEIMCLVEIPATYKTIQKRMLKSPASTRTINISAEYKTIEKRVVGTPATTRKITIPAQYKTITTTEITSQAQERRIKLPARYEDVTSQKLVSEGSMEWREILCETNMTQNRIMDIQKALMAAGHHPGPIDGTIGSDTMRAVNSFQRAKGLPVDKYLNMATVNALDAI